MRNRFSKMFAVLAGVAACSALPAAVHGAGPITDAGLRDAGLRDAGLRDAGLTRFWTAHLPFHPGDRADAAYRVDDTVYVVSRDGFLFSLQADTGLIRWAKKLGAPDSLIAKPFHFWTSQGNGPTGVLAGEGFHVFDRYSGELLFRSVDELDRGGLMAGAERSVFSGSARGRAYSFKLLGSGGVLQRWELELGASITAAPLLFGDQNVLFATHSGLVVACSALDKAFRWRFRAGGAVRGDPTVNESGVYVASEDRSLYKLDGVSGRVVWRARFPCALVDGPIATATHIYQHCGLEGLFCVDAISGKILWNVETGSVFAAQLPGRVAMRTTDGKLLIVDNRSGAALATFDVDGGTLFAQNPEDDAVYLAYGDGRVICVRPAGTPYLTGAEAEAARNRLTVPPAVAGHPAAGVGSEPSPDRGKEESDADMLRSRRDKK